MIETAVALALAHVLADFVFQTDRMVAGKHKPQWMALHLALVGGLSWAALGFAPEPALLGWIVASHGVIDAAKIRWGRGGFQAFALDQAGHAAALLAAALAVPDAMVRGLWPHVGDAVPVAEAMTLAAGLVATVWAGGHAVAALMKGVEPPPDATSLPRGGRMIGKLERFVILMLVLSGHPDGIGLLIAAKSILRFNELSGAADRHVSEYVIIGTLASFAWAIAAGFATVRTLAALAP